MAFEPHPWFIGLEGVEHSAEVARNLAWVATSGASGIVKPTDLRVRAQSVPDGSVRIGVGGFVVESKYSGASQQSYVERVPTVTDLEVPATGSSGGATRYVVARISDPDYPGGGTVPAVPNDGVYAAPFLVSSLSSSRTEIPLAKIVQPANTGTITNAMITDLRTIANPRRVNMIYARPRLMADDDPRQNFCNARFAGAKGEWYGEYFPGGDGSPSATGFDVPSWATHVSIRADWLAVRGVSGKNAHGRYWVEYGDDYNHNGWGGGKDLEFATQQFAFDTTGSQGSYRLNWALMDQVPIPSKLRGKRVQFAFKAGLSAGADTNGVMMNALSGLGMDVTFVEAPIDSDTL